MRKCAHAPCRREIPEADALRWAIGEGLHRLEVVR